MHTIPIFSEDKNTVKGNLIPDLKEVEKHFQKIKSFTLPHKKSSTDVTLSQTVKAFQEMNKILNKSDPKLLKCFSYPTIAS